ncbi:DUF4846 domain-containing protein [Aequorivita xiaoshiensis]|uniref:DUF4846 domain-containing protein n=1 Tax=Aequorivita xiaoshiensis TaxID=2874476 RepID=A0A9X1R1P4_9FLAO|nr:DUF4846 domain-containing protein [Aequorivita xiaoshiensis]MCG2431838.1 DUF4846 domain-containing protein [Aequorivita xiaoshiensis]
MTVFYGCSDNNEKIAVNKTGETLIERVLAPEGYEWIVEDSGSFGEFLQNTNLKKDGSPILDYNQKSIRNQSEHIAILDYDIGNKDLQQCADAIIRLRAEYLFEKERFDEISFHFTNGDSFSWNDYKNGIRPKLLSPSKVSFEQVASKNDSYESFRKYLDVVFMYAGTISLNNETKKVTNNSEIKTGDFLVTPGSPGHAVIVVGRAINKNGDIVYLLAEGYTPAQSIHVLTNPYNSKINPWYTLDVAKKSTITARYLFRKTNIRTFKN